ncbi:MAG: ATP-binding protein, partial [Bryobacteraceae bacterium]
FADRDGGLWLALDSGISRVEAGAALSIFAEGSGLKGAVQSVARHKDVLYAATDYGLFRLRPATAHAPAVFVPLKDLKQTVWCLLSTETGLLAGGVDGVYLVDGERSRLIYTDDEVYFLKRRLTHPELIFAGGAGGLSALYQERGQWTGIPVDGIGADDGLRELTDTPDGTIWMGTEYSSVIRWPAGPARIEVLSQKHGLPESWVKPFFVADRLVFGTRKGLFRFDETARRFVPEPFFGARFADGSREIHALAEDARGNLWIATSEENVRLRRAGSGYETDFGPLGLTAGSLAENIHIDRDGAAVWVGTLEGVIRYDPSAPSPPTAGFRTILRGVDSPSGPASLAGSAAPVLSLSRGALRLSYASPAYSDSARNEYQVFLAGFDRELSSWTRDTTKEYTNLPGGRYEFRVKSRDVYGRIGEEARFPFTVSQPWYRTWWAIGLALAACCAVLYAAGRGRVHLLEARNRRLEAVVARRTLELSHKNEELVMLNQEKNEFLGMAAHDLKNPLSAIRGYAEEILEDHEAMSAGEKLEYVGSMHKAAGRMIDLVTNLLDVNRIERGALELLIEPFDLADAAARTVKAYELRAQAKQIRLHFEALVSPAIVMADPRYVLQVLDNLISNAVKYSPQGREVHVRVRAETGGVLAEVRDQGPGLTPEDQCKLFQKFQRLSAKPTAGESSTGLGLTIVKRLVEAMKGRVWCESAPGQGAAFYVELPTVACS